MTEVETLRAALRAIHHDLRWFFACGGSVSRDDMMSMIDQANKRIQEIRDVVWPEGEEGE